MMPMMPLNLLLKRKMVLCGKFSALHCTALMSTLEQRVMSGESAFRATRRATTQWQFLQAQNPSLLHCSLPPFPHSQVAGSLYAKMSLSMAGVVLIALAVALNAQIASSLVLRASHHLRNCKSADGLPHHLDTDPEPDSVKLSHGVCKSKVDRGMGMQDDHQGKFILRGRGQSTRCGWLR